MQPSVLTDRPVPLDRLSSLLAELEDLKRQQPAHYSRSIATTLFVESWQRLLAGENVDNVATQVTTKALVAILLPGCDAVFFREAGLDQSAAVQIYRKSLHKSAHERVAPVLYEKLSASVPVIVDAYFDGESASAGVRHHAGSDGFKSTAAKPNDETPTICRTPASVDEAPSAWFVNVLCQQPRAGATKPGKPRLLLIPPEMHSDHCLTTAVFAALLSPHYGAPIALPFLTGLSHHLHNAVLPDCGFGGEVLLNDWLSDIIRNAQDKALADLDDTLAEAVRESLRTHEDLHRAEGRAASAADVLDRVLDVQWRTRAAHVRNEDILSELDLVHEGPIKTFQTDLLREAGVWG